MIITFIGPPGSGKGTQAATIASKLQVPHFSIGDILRDKSQSDDQEGKDLKSMMADGKLVPSDIVNKLVLEATCHLKKGCILDGYPRNLEQAEFLEAHCSNKASAIYFDISHDLLIQRITGRFSCAGCGRIYNKFFSLPETEGLCDGCGSHEFKYRSDDNEKTVNVRLEEYNNNTKPLIEYYKNLGRLKVVDASKPVEQITKELQLALKND